MQKLVLEKSTHTHVIEAPAIESTDYKNGIIKMKLEGTAVVTHGEHGTVKTESDNVIKYVQQELNPVTQAMQNAFD